MVWMLIKAIACFLLIKLTGMNDFLNIFAVILIMVIMYTEKYFRKKR